MKKLLMLSLLLVVSYSHAMYKELGKLVDTRHEIKSELGMTTASMLQVYQTNDAGKVGIITSITKSQGGEDY